MDINELKNAQTMLTGAIVAITASLVTDLVITDKTIENPVTRGVTKGLASAALTIAGVFAVAAFNKD